MIIETKSALLLLLLDGDGYGVELIKRAKEKTAGLLVLNEGSVYPALRAMADKKLGYIRFIRHEDSRGSREAGGRPREVFGLTPKGRGRALVLRQALAGFIATTGSKS